jgi:GAF domain-containing protein
LQVINSSPGDLAPVFDAILEKAHSLCGAATGVLLVHDGEDWSRLAAVHGEVSFVEAWRELGRMRRQPGGWWAAQLARGEVVHVADAASLYRNDPQRWRMLELSGSRTLLVVPLRREEEWVGTITAGRRDVHPFSVKQIALLQNFAAQAVIAMENARLLGELRQRTDEVAELNRGLEARVAEQVEELGRVGRLKRFLAPQLADNGAPQEAPHRR